MRSISKLLLFLFFLLSHPTSRTQDTLVSNNVPARFKLSLNRNEHTESTINNKQNDLLSPSLSKWNNSSLLLTVVIQYCNRSLLLEYVKSISEFFPLIEIVIVDDSLSGINQSLNTLSEYEINVQTILQPNDTSYCSKLQSILSIATGKYIMVFPENSILTIGSMAIIVKTLKETDVDCLYFERDEFVNSSSSNGKSYVPKTTFQQLSNQQRQTSAMRYINKEMYPDLFRFVCLRSIYKQTLQYLQKQDLDLMESNRIFFFVLWRIETCITIKNCPMRFISETFPTSKVPSSSQYRFNRTVSSDSAFLNSVEQMISQQQITECKLLLDSIREAMINNHITRFFELSDKDSQTAFNLLVSHHGIIPVVKELQVNFSDKIPILIEKIKGAQCLERTKKSIKTIGLLYWRYCYGGVERVMSLQIAQFLKMGYNVVLFTEHVEPSVEFPLPEAVIRVQLPTMSDNNRGEQLYSALKTYNVDLLLHHQSYGSMFLYDLLITKSLGIPLVLTRHGITLHGFQYMDRTFIKNHLFYSLADKLLVLSHVEETYYRVFNVNCQYFPNPLTFTSLHGNYSSNEGAVLWVGRLDQGEKRYKDALEIMRDIIRNRPDTDCYIVGSAYDSDSAPYIRSFLSHNGFERNIHWVGHVSNIQDYYSKASVMLVTSPAESWSMAILESRMFGIPLVTYDLPTLELLRSRKGYISVPQRDTKRAAEVVLKLLESEPKRIKLSEEAIQSVLPFLQFDYQRAWSQLFEEMIKSPDSDKNSSTVPSSDVRLFLEDMHIRYQELCSTVSAQKSSALHVSIMENPIFHWIHSFWLHIWNML